MKKSAKLLSCFMALTMIASCFGQTVSAVEVDCRKYKDFVYTDYDAVEGTVRVVNYTGTKKTVAVPSNINGDKVTQVSGMQKAKTVETMKIPATVSYLRVSKAPALTKIIVDKNNKNFTVKNKLVLNKKGTIVRSCPGGLTTAKIPDGVTNIYHQAFAGAKIKNITFGENVKSIDTYAFDECKKLTSVTFNKGLKTIGNSAFEDCKKLEKVVINNTKNAPKIGNDAFDDTKTGIAFYVKNKSVAKQLKRNLKNADVDNGKIYVGTKLAYSNI